MSWFSNSGAVRWNSVEIEFQNPSLAARPSPSASLIISVNLLIKMSCKRFPSFHSDHYQHARAPRWIPELLSPLRGEHIQSTRSANRFEKVTKGFESQENVECYNKPALWRRWRCFDDWKKLFYGFAVWSMRQISWANAGFSLGWNQQQRRDEIKRVVGAGHKSGHGESELWTQIETQRAWNQSSKLNQDTRRGCL